MVESTALGILNDQKWILGNYGNIWTCINHYRILQWPLIQKISSCHCGIYGRRRHVNPIDSQLQYVYSLVLCWLYPLFWWVHPMRVSISFRFGSLALKAGKYSTDELFHKTICLGGNYINMMTSLKGNIYRVTVPLWGESISNRSPLPKASDAELCCFLGSVPEQPVEHTVEAPVIRDDIALIMASL